MAAPAVVREVPRMALVVRAIPAALAAMELRSLLGSLAFPHIWDRIPLAVAAAVEVTTGMVPEALAEAALAAQERVVLAVVAVVAVVVKPMPVEPAEPVAWRFNMPTTAMWHPET